MKPRRVRIIPDGASHVGSETRSSHQEERPPAQRDLRAATGLRRALLIGCLVGGAVYGAVAGALHLGVDTERIGSWLAPRLSASLNRPVSIGQVDVALFPRPSIHVAGLRVDNLPDFEGPALAFAERVRLDLRWLPLLLGRLEVHRVRVDGPRLYLAFDEDGTSNFGDLVPTGAEATSAPHPVSLQIRRLDVAEASLSYFDAPGLRSFTVSGADARVSLVREEDQALRADVALEADSLLTRVASVTDEILRMEGPVLTLTARVDPTRQSVDIGDGAVELADERLSVTGRLTGLGGAHPRYDLQLTNDSMDAGFLAAIVPSATRASHMPVLDGELAVTLQLAGPDEASGQPLLRGSLRLDRVGVRLDGNLVLDDVSGTVGVSPARIRLDSLTGRFADGPFVVSGALGRESRYVALEIGAAPDLDALDRLGIVPGGTTLSGRADVDVMLTGRLDAPDSMNVSGEVGLEGVQARHARLGTPVYVPRGRVGLSEGTLTWSELVVLVGEDELITSGRADGLGALVHGDTAAAVPSVTLALRGARLDLGASLSQTGPTTSTSYARVAFAHLGGQRVNGRAPRDLASELGISRPRSLPLRGSIHLELDTLDFREYRLAPLSADIDLDPSALEVRADTFGIWGGTARGSLALAVGPRPSEPFEMTLALEGVSAQELLSAMTPVGDAVTGLATLELEATGALDARLLPLGRDLAGRARLSLSEGRVRGTGPNLVVADFLGSDEWADVPFTTWTTDLEIVDRRLEVSGSELTGIRGRVAFAGTVHFDGSHDLSVGLSIPPDRLSTVSLRRTGIGQSVLDHLVSANSPLELGLRMSGVLRAPVLEPDASSAVALAR